MKKTTLLLISLLLTSSVFCQFTMNSSYNLVPGENYRMDLYNDITSIDSNIHAAARYMRCASSYCPALRASSASS